MEHTGNDNFICKQYEIVVITIDLDLDTSLKEGVVNKQLCLLLSPDPINKYLDYVEVAPLTADSSHLPTRIEIAPTKKSALGKTMYVMLDKKRTILAKRVISKLGDISKKEKETIFLTLMEYYRVK